MKQVLTLLIGFLIVFPCGGSTQDNDVVYAVGENSTLLRLVGPMDWEAVPVDSIPGCGDLLSVWGSSDQDIYVAGCDNELLHFDGTQWHKIAMANPYVDITAVSGTGPDNIYAGGFIPGESPVGTSYHFDGVVWSELSGGGIIQQVWADPGGGFYSFGLYYDPLDRYYYQRVKSYRNGTWNSENLMIGSANPYYFEDEYYGISGRGSDRPVVTGYWEHITVGGGGAIHVKENSTWDAMREYYPCGIWSLCPVLSTVWHAVYCVSEDEIWFAGENGMVMRWTPWGKQEYNLQLPITFRSIWVGPGNKVYVAGDNGYIVHYYNSSFWLVMNTYTTENLHGIWGYHVESVAARLQSFSTSVDESGITIHWSLSELEEGTRFRITRTSLHESFALLIDDDPDLERKDLSFTYMDANVEPGGAYEYLVECSSAEGWYTLFESGIISMPEVRLALLPNYPNPFNPSTAITYSIPAQSQVTVRIFDVEGNIVRTILDTEQPPGRYTVHWNGLNDRGHRVASGTYFCRFTAGKQSLSRKMLLMR